MRPAEIRALMSSRVAGLYDIGSVYFSHVNRERLSELGFRRKTFPGAEKNEIWILPLPETFRFPRYIAVYVGDDLMGILYGITDHLLSRQGWKAEHFRDFCYTASFRNPRGEEGFPEIIGTIDGILSKMLEEGAVELEEDP
ncbi:MAG: hypothetical protein A3205_05825 [Methanomassiliicoccales archaeon Mx-03]|nr:MAG: hypothetical protein A3205_05825 [Methanomassiliicoccales archaeon Mx-03]